MNGRPGPARCQRHRWRFLRTGRARGGGIGRSRFACGRALAVHVYECVLCGGWRMVSGDEAHRRGFRDRNDVEYCP